MANKWTLKKKAGEIVEVIAYITPSVQILNSELDNIPFNIIKKEIQGNKVLLKFNYDKNKFNNDIEILNILNNYGNTNIKTIKS